MQSRIATWHDVSPGMFIQPGPDWPIVRIDDIRPPWVLLTSAAGEQRPHQVHAPAEQILIWEPTLEEAEQTAYRILGGIKIAERGHPGEPWLLAPMPLKGDLAMWRTHLKMFHGAYTEDIKTMKALREAHAESHVNPDPHFFTAHIHQGEI